MLLTVFKCQYIKCYIPDIGMDHTVRSKTANVESQNGQCCWKWPMFGSKVLTQNDRCRAKAADVIPILDHIHIHQSGRSWSSRSSAGMKLKRFNFPLDAKFRIDEASLRLENWHNGAAISFYLRERYEFWIMLRYVPNV